MLVPAKLSEPESDALAENQTSKELRIHIWEYFQPPLRGQSLSELTFDYKCFYRNRLENIYGEDLLEDRKTGELIKVREFDLLPFHPAGLFSPIRGKDALRVAVIRIVASFLEDHKPLKTRVRLLTLGQESLELDRYSARSEFALDRDLMKELTILLKRFHDKNSRALGSQY